MFDLIDSRDPILRAPVRDYTGDYAGLIFCREYSPIGRYAEAEEDVATDERVPSGIPDEVLGPDGDWMDLRAFMHLVTAQWRRPLARPAIGGRGSSPEKKAKDVSFLRVLNYRIEKHEAYASATRRNLGDKQLEALKTADPVARWTGILESLGISEPVAEDYDEVLDWLESSAVQTPWAEYVRSCAGPDADTRNPLWARVQWCLSRSNRERGDSGWERLGYGDWERPIDKSRWSQEDHACRFILHFYHLLTHPELPREYDVHGALVEEFNVGQRITEAYDERDSAWLGYALFCLLIRSWQYKQHCAEGFWDGDQGLVPAMYEAYNAILFTEYPPLQVGVVNLSPFTPWVYEDHMPKNFEYWTAGDDDEYEHRCVLLSKLSCIENMARRRRYANNHNP